MKLFESKKTWHITTATHNSRYSQRMFDNYVKSGKPVWLSEREEVIVTETIADITEKDKLNIIAYNICGDHMHILLVCNEVEVPKIVGKLKAMSARVCNIEMGRTKTMGHAVLPETMGHAPLSETGDAVLSETGDAPLSIEGDAVLSEKKRGETQTQLWTQKFGCKKITSEKQLNNTIKYIQKNRQKHQLPENAMLQDQIKRMTCTPEHAFRIDRKPRSSP